MGVFCDPNQLSLAISWPDLGAPRIVQGGAPPVMWTLVYNPIN
jgi:hypothetical protein